MLEEASQGRLSLKLGRPRRRLIRKSCANSRGRASTATFCMHTASRNYSDTFINVCASFVRTFWNFVNTVTHETGIILINNQYAVSL